MTTEHAAAPRAQPHAPTATLAQQLAQACARWADRTALVSRHGNLTYGELAAAAGRAGAWYARRGIGAGDRVLTSLSNRPEMLIALAAAWRCGAVHVGTDRGSTAPELIALINRTDARALVLESATRASEAVATARAVLAARPDLAVAIVGDDGEDLPRFSDVLAYGDDGAAPAAQPAAGDQAIVFVSSGTTGTPKATIGYHGNLGERWQRLGGWLGFGPEDAHLAQLPLSHGFGLMMAVSALLAGGRLVLLERFSVQEALAAIERERITVFNGAPTHFRLLLDRLDAERHDVDSLRLSVGTAAAFPAPLVHEIWDRLGVRFMFMYGSSEGVGFATTDREDILLGSVGRAAPGSVAVVDGDRNPLETGELGELAFSRNVFPIRSLGADDDGAGEWYYSGDRGRLDEQGRLYVYGRLKHQIDRGGLKVDPVEVEAALLASPRIADAAVIGQPDPILGEVVCACVVTTGEQPQPRLGEMRDALGRWLAPHKLPDEMRYLPAIPRTDVGKVDLEALRHVVDRSPHIIERRTARETRQGGGATAQRPRS
jgi:acyl-coenzyme A synthetase/AMP-(fatty) acid ligase